MTEEEISEWLSFLTEWRTESEIEDEGIDLEFLRERGYSIEEKEVLHKYPRKRPIRIPPTRWGIRFDSTALIHIWNAIEAIRSIERTPEGEEISRIEEILEEGKREPYNIDFKVGRPRERVRYHGFDKELARRYRRPRVSVSYQERDFRELLRLGRLRTRQEREKVIFVEVLVKYYKIMWMRTQFARLYYATIETEATPTPLCEFRVYVYHTELDKYLIREFSAIEYHMGLIQSLKAVRSHDTWLESIEEIVIIAVEEAEPIGDNDVQPEAVNYVHRHAVWFKQRDKPKEYSEVDFTKWELDLLAQRRLSHKLHHIEGKLIPAAEERDYDLKYV